MAANNYSQCFAAASEAAGRELSDDDLDTLFSRAQSRISRYTREGLTPAQAAQRAGRELGEEARLARAIEARSQRINFVAQKALADRVIEGREYDSIMGTITGVEKAYGDTLRGALTGKNKGANEYGLGDSVDARGNAAVARVLGAMELDLRKAGLLKPLLKGDKKFSRDLANELGRLSDPNWGEDSGNKFAKQAAQIIGKHLEDTRLAQNEAGAWIGKLDQYITRQSHDADKIRGDGSPAAYQRWRDAILPKLDDRTFLDHDAPAEREAYLRGIYNNLATGNHEGAIGADWLGGFKGPANLAKRASAERKLFFKSANDWFDYNEQFGHGDVRGSVYKQIEHGARNAALMRVLGTNPEAMVQGWVSKLIQSTKDRGDVNQGEQIQREAGKFSGIMEYVMRKGTGSEVPKFTRMMAAMRSIQDFKLGGPLSYLSDLGTIASVARHNGISLFDSYVNGIRALFPASMAEKDLASELGAGAEGFSGSLIAKMRSYDGVRGQLASLASTYEKLNGVKYWVQHEKEALGRMLSHNLALKAGTEFAALDGRLQTTLRRYGIDQAEWDKMRAAPTRMVDGREYLLPAEVHAATGDMQLMEKLSSFYQDQVRVGLSEPTAGISRSMLGDKRPATVTDEIRRAVLQFKTFPMTHVLRSLTRELFRDGLDVGGVAHLLASTSLLGYTAYSMKKLMRGQQPVLPDNRDDAVKAVMEGVAQGGGLGIYGDFIFGQKSRWGGDALTEFLGPTYSMVNQAASAVITDLQKAAQGEHPAKGWGREILSQGVDFAKRNGPMVNLWYARAAMDYLFLYSLQEQVNPGYLHRYETQLTKDQGVKFLARPTTAHLRTFGR